MTGILMGNALKIEVREITVDLANTPTITTAVTSVTVPGLNLNDFVFVNKPSHETGLGIVNCRVSAVDTLEITTLNPTVAGINAASETFLLLVIQGGNLG